MRRFLTTIGAADSAIACLPYGRGVIQLIQASTAFTVPAGVTRMRVHCLGGGGSGGAVRFDYAVNRADFARGGGGGGYAVKEIEVTPGQSHTVTVGAGGAAKALSSGNTSVAGNAGGTTSFGALLSATGGLGGTVGVGAVPAATVLGGSGVGGDMNFSGGDGGKITLNTPLGSVATGGGAAGSIYGKGSDGIGVTSAAASVALLYATGGGAVGAIDYVAAAANQLAWLLGLGAGASQLSEYSRFYLTSTKDFPVLANMVPYVLNGKGANGASAAGDGGGGTGYATDGTFSLSNATTAGLFGGGGGVLLSSTTTGQSVASGKSVLGGGGGGVSVFCDGASATSGEGGRGMVIVEF